MVLALLVGDPAVALVTTVTGVVGFFSFWPRHAVVWAAIGPVPIADLRDYFSFTVFPDRQLMLNLYS